MQTIHKMYSVSKWAVSIAAILVMSACGGGGGGTPKTTVAPGTNSPAKVAPSIASVTPAEGATAVGLSSLVKVTFATEMDQTTVVSPATPFSLKETVSGIAIPAKVTFDGTAKTAILTPTADFAPERSYTATITAAAKDYDGVSIPAKTWTFVTAKAGVSYMYPNADVPALPINGKIFATFNQQMKASTLASPSTAFTVKQAGTGTIVTGTVAYDTNSKTAVFTPASELTANTTYIATITTAATFADGSPMASGATWTFTTAAGRDTATPVVVVSSPSHADVNVSSGTSIKVTFNEAMDPFTLNNTTVLVHPQGNPGAPVAGTVVVDMAAKMVTFTPTTKLAPGTIYDANVTKGAKDLAGNVLSVDAEGFLFSFTTGAGA